MPRKSLVRTDLLPGTARIVVQLYDGSLRAYRQPPGFSVSRVRVDNGRELDRLWKELQVVLEERDWSDANVKKLREAQERNIAIDTEDDRI